MRLSVLLSLLFASALFTSGCTTDHRSPHVPWWKGIPASLLTPDSQEAYGWHRQRHGHGTDGLIWTDEEAQVEPEPIPSEPPSPISMHTM